MSIPNLDYVSLVDVFGAGSVDVHLKFTSEAVLDRWSELMVGINDVINIEGSPGNPASDQITGAQLTNFQNSINGLLDLAKNGHTFQMTDPNDSDALITVRDVITVQMARDLDNLLRTIESADSAVQVSGTTATISLAALQAWRDFAEVTPVINDLVRHMNNARSVGGVYQVDEGYKIDGKFDELGRLKVGSLQAMVELLYVKTGTELMADNLDNLESALTANKNAIEALTSLQSYHNEITAFSKGQLPVELGDQDSGTSIIRRTNYAGTVGPFFDGITPELGPGMASMYEALTDYQNTMIDTYNTLNSINQSSGLTNIFPLLEGTATVFLGGTDLEKTNFWNKNRSKLFDVIKTYREEVTKMNTANSKLNELMQPFIDLLTETPGTPVIITVNGVNYELPLNPIPLPIPNFSTQDMPGFIDGSGLSTNEQSTVTTNDNANLQEVNAFIQNNLFLFKDALDEFTVNTPPNTYNLNYVRFDDPNPNTSATAPRYRHDPSPNNFVFTKDFLNILYGKDKVINGDPAKGASPIAILDMAKNIKAQKALIDAQIANLAADENQANNPNTLLARLRAVSNDLQKNGIDAIPDISTFALMDSNEKQNAITQITAFSKKWILDGLTDLTGSNSFAGKIQENLGFAISAGQSLNDQQKEETRRYLFLFEEFYKSASAILTKITQLLEKMAQNINR